MKYRKFLYCICAALVVFFMFNLVVWNLFTRDVLAKPDCAGGDLTRMGYIRGSMSCRQVENDLPKSHINIKDYNGQQIAMLTIGDSFSNGGGNGRNSFYQDYIASTNRFSVLNIPPYKDIDKVTTVSLWNNNGYLDRIKPRYVLIEYSEKECSKITPETIDLDKKLSEAELKEYAMVRYDDKPEKNDSLLHFDFISEANLKFIRNSIFYRFSEKAPGSPVYRVKLNGDFFTVTDSSTLLFYKNDLKSIVKLNKEFILQLNNKLNILSDRLAAKGITLYFMPCVDKYNLYSRYIISNKYPESTFFEEFRKLPKRYGFIDTKAILLDGLQKGEKDIYYADDTHWSWKASQRIFETVRFQ